MSDRDVSPQRLAYYRDNWYIVAWCRTAGAPRTFSVDRIQRVETLNAPAKFVPEGDLVAHLESDYGISSGTPRRTALPRFGAEQARWVADERSHPAQTGQFTTDGHYELAVPYGEPTEVIGDILRLGAEVEALAPADLRDRMRVQIERMRERYR